MPSRKITGCDFVKTLACGARKLIEQGIEAFMRERGRSLSDSFCTQRALTRLYAVKSPILHC